MTAFAPDASLLAAWVPTEKPSIHLWDLKTGREAGSFPDTEAYWPGNLFFAPDGQTLFVLGRRTVGYNVRTGKREFSWRMKLLPARAMTVAVGGQPPTEGKRVAWRTATISPDGRLFACILTNGGFDRERLENRIVLCEARTGRVLRRWSDSGVASRMYEQLAFSPDGRLLATSDESAIHLWEVATGKEVCLLRGHRGEIATLNFGADGRRLVSGSLDSTVLVWDLAQALGRRRPLPEDAARDVATLWADLAGDDAVQAQAAIWQLADAPTASVPFLERQLRPDAAADQEQIRQEVRDLDDARFAVRDRAFGALERRGPAAEPALRAALTKKPSLETRRRLEQLLEALDDRPLRGEPLRTIRALTVLEHAGSPEAERLLRKPADGDPDGWLTAEAKATCARLARRRVAAAAQ